MEKTVAFIIHKSTDENLAICQEWLNQLVKIPNVNYKHIVWSGEENSITATDIYNQLRHRGELFQPMYDKAQVLPQNTWQNSIKADFVILLNDIDYITDRAFVIKSMKIFDEDASIGLIGLYGTREIPYSGVVEDSLELYGRKDIINENGVLDSKVYSCGINDFVEVEAVSGSPLIFRGDEIPLRSGVHQRILGEIASWATRLQRKRVVVPGDNSEPWCVQWGSDTVLNEDERKRLKTDKDLYFFLQSLDHPLLTIGIPTYNRGIYLEKCLAHIYSQIGDWPFVEVFVSDNDSSDNTAEIVKRYSNKPSLRYYKQPVNIVAKNFDYLYDNANGDFVVDCGDDDYYSEGTILCILESIMLNPKASVIGLSWWGDKKEIAIGKGLDDFLITSTMTFTSISSVVLKKKIYDSIEDKSKYDYTHLNQIYQQLEMVRMEPFFNYIHGKNFAYYSGEALYKKSMLSLDEQLGYGKVFFDEQYEIIESFLEKGLSAEALKKEKIINMNKALSWFRTIKREGNRISWRIDDNIIDIVKRHFGQESYSSCIVKEIEKIVSG